MLKKFMDNCCKPEGKFGYYILKGMNIGHSSITQWAIPFLPFCNNQKILDIGCGGGANVTKLLRSFPLSKVDGVDYSKESIKLSQKKNLKYINKRCNFVQANVRSLPFSDECYDGAIAIETIYFWEDIILCFKEVNRILKKNGYFAIVCEMSDPIKGKKWSKYCDEMNIYSPKEIEIFLELSGFTEIKIYQKGVWSLLIGKKI